MKAKQLVEAEFQDIPEKDLAEIVRAHDLGIDVEWLGPGYFRYQEDDEVWYKLNGKLHREDGPALTHSDGTTSWYKYGQLHRDDGPAIELAGGDKSWYKNGEFVKLLKASSATNL